MRGLRTQLSLSIMLVTLLTVAIISFSFNILISTEFKKHTAEKQRKKVEELLSNFNHQYDARTDTWNVEYIHGAGMYALFDGYILKIYDKNDKTIWDAENHDMVMCAKMMQEISERMAKNLRDDDGQFISFAHDLVLDGQKIGSMIIRYYTPYFLTENDFRFLNTLNLVLALVVVISLIASFIIGAILAKRITNPITKTAYIAHQISAGDYSLRFEGKTKSKELDELVSAINCLSAALSEQEALRKQMTIDVAHELRTPLTTLSSHLEAMIEGVWEPKKERLQSCYEEINRLSGLVTDLGRLADMEDNQVVPYRCDVDLMDIARTWRDHFEIELKKKNLSLEIRGVSSYLYADSNRLNQIMTNLLSNAVKYTRPYGHILIEIIDTDTHSILAVEDDGIGIPEKDLPFIFERFYRTDKSRNRATGGAGIGLAIVKSIVAKRGGTIEVISHAEQGARFVITLPKQWTG